MYKKKVGIFGREENVIIIANEMFKSHKFENFFLMEKIIFICGVRLYFIPNLRYPNSPAQTNRAILYFTTKPKELHKKILTP
jgi:hypothetical protein